MRNPSKTGGPIRFYSMNKITSTDQALRILASALTGNTLGVAAPTAPTTKPTTRRVAHIGGDGVAHVAIDVQRRITNALASVDRKVDAAKASLETLCSLREERADDLGGLEKVGEANRKDWVAFGVRKDSMLNAALGNA
jgi:hypothetical protein